ncbi:MAG: tetratricopeptide repeat protein [Desulfurivibrionaceae bacterium]
MSLKSILRKPIIILIFPLSAFFLLSGCSTHQQVSRQTQPIVESETWDREGKLSQLKYRELLKRGNYYLDQNNLELAKLHFTMAVKERPRSAPAYTGLAKTFSRNEQYENSEKAFDKALASDPLYKPALIASGRLHRDQGNYSEAIELLNRARKHYPENPEVLTELAIAYDMTGQEPKAEPLYKQVVDLNPEDAASHNNLGFNYFLQKKYQEAVDELQQALKLQPDNDRIRNNLATAYALNGNEERAYQLLVKTIGEAGAYNNIGYLYMIKGMWEKAEQTFKKALNANPVFYSRAQENLKRLQKLQNANL